MVYEVTKVIKSSISNEEYIKLCKKEYYNMVKICLTVLIIGAALILLAVNWDNGFTRLTAGIALLPTIISLMILCGNMASKGIIFEYLDCETIQDWIGFAERNITKLDGETLSKKLEIYNKEIKDICLDSKELRCVDTVTGDISILELSRINTCKNMFSFVEKSDLAFNEMELDISNNKIKAFINKI